MLVHLIFNISLLLAPRAQLGQAHTGKASPDVQFANATTDRALRAFVAKYGPIAAAHVTETAGEIWASQPWDVLRSEHTVFRAVAELLALLRAGTLDQDRMRDAVQTISSGVQTWPAQWDRERAARRSDQLDGPAWSFNSRQAHIVKNLATSASVARHPHPLSVDPINAAHGLLCEIFNSFPPVVYRWGDEAVEYPHVSGLKYGIRPLLYYLLRLDYLAGEIKICEYRECQQIFTVEKRGQRFCDADCSRRERQRDYWRRRGSALRRKRSSPSARKARRR